MRVITGSARGKRLITLEGNDVRPTTDKVKEAVFSIIQFDIPGAKALDLFGGSGQLGIEALSRGAKSAVFVDKNRAALNVIRQNIENCGFGEASRVIQSDALDYLKNCPEFDIIFLDPPYNLGLLEEALPLVSRRLAPGGTVICEHEGTLKLPDSFDGLRKIKEYSYGKHVSLTTFRAEDDEK